MKTLLSILTAIVFILLLAAPNANADGAYSRYWGDVRFESGAKVIALPGSSVDLLNATNYVLPFSAKVQITSGTAGVLTGTFSLPYAYIPAGKAVYVEGYSAAVSGSTVWSGITGVSLITTGTAPVTYATVPVASLTANAVVLPIAANVTADYALLTPVPSGLVLTASATTTGTVGTAGSPATITVFGVIK